MKAQIDAAERSAILSAELEKADRKAQLKADREEAEREALATAKKEESKKIVNHLIDEEATRKSKAAKEGRIIQVLLNQQKQLQLQEQQQLQQQQLLRQDGHQTAVSSGQEGSQRTRPTVGESCGGGQRQSGQSVEICDHSVTEVLQAQ